MTSDTAQPQAAPAPEPGAAAIPDALRDAPPAGAPAAPSLDWANMGRAFRHPNYRLFFGGQLISLIGTWMQSVAQSWLVYRLTGSELLLGMVGFTSQISVFLLAPLGGAVADRWPRRSILVATQSVAMAQALILAALTLTGTIQVWHIFVLAGLLGLVNAFDLPARQSFAVELVGKSDLQNAIALNSSMFNSARMIGPAIAGLLVALVGEGWCFLINGVSYLAVLASLLKMRQLPRGAALRKGSLLFHLLEAAQYVRRTKPVLALLLMLGLASLTGMPYMVLMPVFAKEVLHSGPSGLGLLMSCAGLGALLAALTLAVRPTLRGLEAWVGWASLSFGAGLIAMSSSRVFALSCGLLVVVGYAMMIQMASSNTLIQHMVPDALRGRVMAFYSMMFMGMAPFGALLAGSLAHRLGAPLTVALGGGVGMLGALWFLRRLPRFRRQAGISG